MSLEGPVVGQEPQGVLLEDRVAVREPQGVLLEEQVVHLPRAQRPLRRCWPPREGIVEDQASHELGSLIQLAESQGPQARSL